MIASADSTTAKATAVSPNRRRVRVASTTRATAAQHLRSSSTVAPAPSRSILRMAEVSAALLVVALCCLAPPSALAFTGVVAPAARSSTTQRGAVAPSVRDRHAVGRAAPLHSHSAQHSKLPVMDAQVLVPTSNDKSKKTHLGEAPAPTSRSLNPTPVLLAAFQDLWIDKTNQKKEASVAAVLSAFALATVLMLSPLTADAAMSGGRIGGSFPSSRQSYSRPAPSSSYSRGYSSGYRSGYGSGFYGRGPGITVVPPPIVAPITPFGGFGFGNPFYFGAPGIITYSRGPSLLDLLLWGGIGLFLFNAFRGAASAVDGAANSFTSVLDDRFGLDAAASALGPGTSVVQLTVALEVPKRDDPSSILSVLNRLATTARTDSRVGIQNLTSQVALELLRRKSSIVSASASSQHYKNRDQALRNYNSASIKERAKFEQETVSQYGGVDYGGSSLPTRSSSSLVDGQATMAVVTLLLAIDGDSTKLPTINSIGSVEEALRKIAGDAKVDTCLQSAEILWTPTDRSETLTLRDVVADYPQLRSV